MLIRYYGHVGLPSGYGDAASEMCMAILGAGFELEISTDGEQCHQRYMPLARCFRNEAELRAPDVVVVHTLPLDCAEVLVKNRIRKRYPLALCVAYTTWEGASMIPTDMAMSLGAFDHVWVPSTGTAAHLVVGTRARVVVVPHPFDESRWTNPPTATREALDARALLGHPYRFYYVGAWSSRKNVDGVVRAYMRAFGAHHEVELVIQSAQAAPSACQVAQFATGIEEHQPVIRFSNQWLSHDDMCALHQSAHCFVTASRGEAWNLPAFDAMLARSHIIAPSGLGSDDFLRETSADLYDARLAPAVGDVRLVAAPDAPPGHAVAQYWGAQGLTVRSDWRDPDLADLSLKMKAAYRQRITHLRINYDPAERFGRVAVGRRIAEILQGAA
jgi:glycosyltransferase involved in cell wall biosynthesis